MYKFETEMNMFRCAFRNEAEEYSQEIFIAAMKLVEANWPQK